MERTDLLTTWGRRLAQKRQAAGLSIGALARRTGIHKSHLARFERGEAGLGDAMRIRVATEIGHQVADLFPYPDTTKDGACRSADSAAAEVASPTRATAGATRSPARSAKELDESGHAANHASEYRGQ